MPYDLLGALRRLDATLNAMNAPAAELPESRRPHHRSVAQDAALVAIELGSDLLVGHDGNGRTVLAFTV